MADEIRALGREAWLLPFDVADRAGSAAALEADVAAHGAYYGVVHNAGVTADAAFPAMTGEAWDRVLRTNLDGFYHVVRPLVMPMVRAKQGGRIVAISSTSGQAGNRGQVNYAASKAGLIGAAEGAVAGARQAEDHRELRGARSDRDGDVRGRRRSRRLAELIPMRRLGRPEEVAAVVAFLFSDGRQLRHGAGHLGQRRYRVSHARGSRRRGARRRPRGQPARAPAAPPPARPPRRAVRAQHRALATRWASPPSRSRATTSSGARACRGTSTSSTCRRTASATSSTRRSSTCRSRR